MTPEETPRRRRDALSWIGAAVAVCAVVVVVWACLTGWGGIVHGHPAYAVLLAITAAGAIGFGAVAVLRPVRRGGWRIAGRIVLVIAAAGWIAAIAWLRPYTAVEPALSAMESDDAVVVTETATRIVLSPADGPDGVGVFFQPGALVDARSYAAVLRPLAESGHTVVITKQALGIAFLAVGDFDAVREEHPEVPEWVLGGHSLGGTVAAIEATGSDGVAGLMFFASYPADDIASFAAPVLSVSGSRDGLATPETIEASRANLPDDAEFVIVDGASHAQFGDYGPQAGDNAPTIDHDDARAQISGAAVDFVSGVAG